MVTISLVMESRGPLDSHRAVNGPVVNDGARDREEGGVTVSVVNN